MANKTYHVHILGVAGTFMAGLTLIARSLGYRVTGSDQHCYPPMSDLLQHEKIDVFEGYAISDLHPRPDMVIMGNTMKRGLDVVEYILNNNIPFISGPQWLYEHVLRHKKVFAVAGTHGKTTTTSMLAWIMEYAGLQPSFLIGGMAQNFVTSARLTDSDFFVIEADEYDTAFFDKRSKFIHYHPDVLVINNLEYDHADIFDDLAAIKRQFNHVVRTVPSTGHIIYPSGEKNIQDVLAMGCWSQQVALSDVNGWQVEKNKTDASSFIIKSPQGVEQQVDWELIGDHNMFNAQAAVAAALQAGIDMEVACAALPSFRPAARRLQCLVEQQDIMIYDDFAHHPTAIASTLAGLRERWPHKRLVCVLELRSFTMKNGTHQQVLANALQDAHKVFVLPPEQITWDVKQAMSYARPEVICVSEPQKLLEMLKNDISTQYDAAEDDEKGSVFVFMSNGSFSGITRQFADHVA